MKIQIMDTHQAIPPLVWQVSQHSNNTIFSKVFWEDHELMSADSTEYNNFREVQRLTQGKWTLTCASDNSQFKIEDDIPEIQLLLTFFPETLELHVLDENNRFHIETLPE